MVRSGSLPSMGKMNHLKDSGAVETLVIFIEEDCRLVHDKDLRACITERRKLARRVILVITNHQELGKTIRTFKP